MNANHSPEPPRKVTPHRGPGPEASSRPSSSCSTAIPSSLPNVEEPAPTVPSVNKAYQRALHRFGHNHPRSGIQGRVCIDPELHSAESHARLHHPDLLKGADFCDAGVETMQDTKIESAGKDQRIFQFKELFDDSSSDEESPVLGYRYRKLTGGDVCKERVDVSIHKHQGHSSAVRVRAAPESTYKYTTSVQGRREVVSKVGPLAQIPPFKHTRQALESPIRREASPSSDQDEIELYHGGVHDSLNLDLEESRVQRPPNDEDTVIFSSRRQTTTDRYPGWSPWKINEALTLRPIRWTPEPECETGTVKNWPHHGHNHISKVRPAVLSSADDPDHEIHETLWSNGRAWNPAIETNARGSSRHFAPSIHSGPSKLPNVQQPFSRKTSSAERPMRSIRARSAGTSKSASELVTYWESLSESAQDSQHTLDFTTTSKQPKPTTLRRGPSQHLTSNESRRKTMTSATVNPDPTNATQPLAGKLDLGRKSSFFRDLIKPYETYQTKLTERPERKISATKLPEADLSKPRTRRLTSKSAASDSIDSKFKQTVDDMEQLLGEAVVLANQVADEQQDHRDENSVDETLPSVYDEPSDGEETKQPIPVPATVKVVTMQSATASGHSSSQRLPRHHCSVPGMHSGNVKMEIPERITSLRKVKTATEGRLNRGLTKPSLPAIRDRFQELSPPVSPFTMPPRPKSLARSPGAANRELGDGDSKQGCLLLGKTLKKSRSCLSCRSWIPLLNHRFSFNQRSGAVSNKVDEEGEDRDVVLEDVAPVSVSAGGVQKSEPWTFDGTNDCCGDGPADEEDDGDNDLLRRSEQTDGVGASEELPPLPQFPMPPSSSSQREIGAENGLTRRLNLRGKSHVSLRGYQGYNLARAYKRHPVARDWSTVRKRFTATVACLSTATVGILIGIYAGLVPSIQYWIADLQHYAILGNVFFYVGLAIPTFLFWPLPLLHGRKPYILSSLVLAMPLLFPQALAVSAQRSPYVSTWRWALLSSRAFMGLALGFASMNFHSILMDLFGASLMTGNPHQEIVDKHDVRRHGGGMGAWLGLWTWCFVGSLGVGFLIGAAIIDRTNPDWGFYVSIMLVSFILLLNVICPEVRRSPFRRSVAEVRNGNRISRRVARGEVMMHRVQDGPTWSPFVGLCVVFISIGALVAIPFQKANIFSRGRHHQLELNEDTFDKKLLWTSHLLRRTLFCLVLPLVGIAYTFASAGPPIPVEVPTLCAALIGVLSGLAISECNGLMMETFDTSDLQPGMTGRPRPRGQSNGKSASKRTNYSSFPRVTAGFAICHTIGYILAAVATAIGGSAQRKLGQQAATGVVAGILMILTLLLLGVLIRFKDVQIIPESKTLEMEKWQTLRRESAVRRRSTLSGGQPPQLASQQPQQPNTLTDEEIWRPLLMGNPSSKMRRVNILELGSMTRWTEIRKKNKLIDETAAAHLNRAALDAAATAIEETTTDLVRKVSSRRSPGVRGPPGLRPGSPPSQGGALKRFYSVGSPVARTGSPVPRADTPVTVATVPPHLGIAMELESFVVDRRLLADRDGHGQQQQAASSSSAPPTTTLTREPSFKRIPANEDYFGMERSEYISGVMGQTVKEEDEDQIVLEDVFEESDFLSSNSDMDVGSEGGNRHGHGGVRGSGDFYTEAVHGAHANDSFGAP
ncbi:hypothetical protein QBC43DRAFT_330077 [Cladorrhinum sp. PSN259]|nr:hypothetical protein QBC43DRAFT_330077 [Cladorrhinum sp. PSN259]